MRQVAYWSLIAVASVALALLPVLSKVYVVVEIYATEGGTTDPAPGKILIPKCSEFTVRAIPHPGYYFVNWVVNGTDAYFTNPLTLTICSYTRILAVFSSAPAPAPPEPEAGGPSGRGTPWAAVLAGAAAGAAVFALLYLWWRRRGVSV